MDISNFTLTKPPNDDITFNLDEKKITLREIIKCLLLIGGAKDILKDELKIYEETK